MTAWPKFRSLSAACDRIIWRPGPAATGHTSATTGQHAIDPAEELHVLGPNDQIIIRAPQADEINERPFRVDSDGNINLPLVGKVPASGLTIQALEADLSDAAQTVYPGSAGDYFGGPVSKRAGIFPGSI